MLKKKHKNSPGFTLVELLIVIVVIAILATVSIVAYKGIQNRAHDSIVQQDIDQSLKQSMLAANTGDLPDNLSSEHDTVEWLNDNVEPSTGSYDTEHSRYPLAASEYQHWSSGSSSASIAGIRFSAASKSGKVFTGHPQDGKGRGTAEWDDIIGQLEYEVDRTEGWLDRAPASAQAEIREELEELQRQLNEAQRRRDNDLDFYKVQGGNNNGYYPEFTDVYIPGISSGFCATSAYLYDAQENEWIYAHLGEPC